MKGRLLLWLPLAHHRPEQLDRCLLLPLWGGRRLALCARCAGLYPTLVGALFLQGALRLGPTGAADWLITMSGVFPALFDWGLGWLGRRRGSNGLRLATGALLGLALSRGLWLYYCDPLSEPLWIQLGVLAAGALAFELVRRLRL